MAEVGCSQRRQYDFHSKLETKTGIIIKVRNPTKPTKAVIRGIAY